MYLKPRKQFSPQQESLDVWQRLTRLLLAAVFVGFAVLTVSFFAPQLERQRAMEVENTDLALARDDLQRQLDLLLRKQERLRADPEYLEPILRDRLNLQRPGETVINIEHGTK